MDNQEPQQDTTVLDEASDMLHKKQRGVGYTRTQFKKHKARVKTKAARRANVIRRK